MCGVGGILGGELSADERESAALRLRAALAHRGPDDVGIFRDGEVALVHTRLSILDPSTAGRQPMRRGPLVLTFNGEIYNHRELRSELAREGAKFDSETDTEVLLALYARDGDACLDRIRGMYALAIWDERDGSCLLARDPFGIKPLYYALRRDGGLVFGSELRALLATGLVERQVDPAGVAGFLATGSVPEPVTMIRDIRVLQAGCSLRWTRAGTVEQGHCLLDFARSNVGGRSDSLRSLLVDSVRSHLISDVPVGLLLSAGLDSSVLLALMRAEGRQDVSTFSVGLENAALDETAPAQALAQHFGLPRHALLLTRELARHWIDDFLDSLDQPTLDGFNTYCACKLASDHGCKVVLSGIGADELFGGYPSFRHVPRLVGAGHLTKSLGLAPAARAASRLPLEARLTRVCDYLGGEPTLARAYGAVRGIFTSAEITRLMPELAGASAAGDQLEQAGLHRDDATAEAISQLELTRYLRNQLLRDADVMSMTHGVELRVPYLDLSLFGFLREVPPARRFAPGKQLLREAVPELPSGLLVPRKRAFTLPFASWMDDDWDDLETELPKASAFSSSTWYRRWSLIVLGRWLKRHGLTVA